jgi:hypothetical protein
MMEGVIVQHDHRPGVFTPTDEGTWLYSPPLFTLKVCRVAEFVGRGWSAEAVPDTSTCGWVSVTQQEYENARAGGRWMLHRSLLHTDPLEET